MTRWMCVGLVALALMLTATVAPAKASGPCEQMYWDGEEWIENDYAICIQQGGRSDCGTIRDALTLLNQQLYAACMM